MIAEKIGCSSKDIYLTMRRDAWCKIYLSDTFVSRNLSENSLNFFF